MHTEHTIAAATTADAPSLSVAPPFRALLVLPTVLPTLPGYDIVAEVGRGGMGVVYQARQRALNRPVAVKMILAGLHADPTARRRFRTEAEAVARLQHPNVVQIHEVGEHEGRPFLALEFVDGGSLQPKVAGQAPPSEREAARLVETLARAVHAMHRRGILHRDLKPTNVLLTADGTPKITDFGLAKLLDDDAGPTRSETLLGTPSYMAPELAAGETTRAGPAADVYSLGAILYELLTGQAPFQGRTPLQTLEQVRTADPVPPRHLRPELSADLQTICLKCLEKEPGKRYASGAALADDLRRLLDGLPIQARPAPLWQRLRRSAQRRPALVVCLTALAVVLLAASGYFHASGQLARHQAAERYRQFVQCRNDAFFYGLLAADGGARFLGTDAAGHLRTAEQAAQDALALADRPELDADQYALLLLLAGLRGQASVGWAGAQEGLQLLDRADRLGMRTRAYHLRRAQFLDQLGEPAEARQERDRAAAIAPAGALDHFLTGIEHYRHGDWAQARNGFRAAVNAAPAHFWAQFLLSMCHLKMQRWEAAQAGLNACLAQQPDFIWAYLFRSFASEQLQAVTEAEADLQRALQLNPTAEARYLLFLTRGTLHFNRQQMERAAADFRAALALKPEQYNAHVNLAHVHLARRQFPEAAARLDAALRLRPPAAVVAGYHVERGRLLLLDRRYAEAAEACATALALAPDQPLPHAVHGHALAGLGRHAEAERSFEQALRLGGADADCDLFLGLGAVRVKLGKYPEAVEDYTRALERRPDADIYQHRGWAHAFAEAWKLALRDFAKALELDPEAGDAYTGRGLARIMLGDYRGAVGDADEALRRRPATPEMVHNLACTLAQAVARAEADEQRSLADRYRRQAVQAVRQCLEMVPPEERRAFWQDKVLPDAALAPIRAEVEFRKLAVP
jgi:serine/threonine-protein kinase